MNIEQIKIDADKIRGYSDYFEFIQKYKEYKNNPEFEIILKELSKRSELNIITETTNIKLTANFQYCRVVQLKYTKIISDNINELKIALKRSENTLKAISFGNPVPKNNILIEESIKIEDLIQLFPLNNDYKFDELQGIRMNILIENEIEDNFQYILNKDFWFKLSEKLQLLMIFINGYTIYSNHIKNIDIDLSDVKDEIHLINKNLFL